MTALTLAIDNAAATARRISGTPTIDKGVPMMDAEGLHSNTRQADDGSDFVLSMLSRARTLIERIADRRRATKIARNRVETRRQLAKLPAWVRKDVLQAEYKAISAPEGSCYARP
ncbi:hypothetical protein [Sinorhizobium fredii]|uniref:hypothetical protein n=1 Tax=Rhizobium fredii TaxID=380 RepID=UPI0004B6B182|nr:hypothetical protein [Sinorhizobium fredii]ASY69285.1 hypothetical protein SF83666_c18680 [Sinorhizobium fredii CCBAU 83666]AWI57570.1 hypothetical protein AB395_00001916 [Sinorhizobium fredii CCBAU 45436]AWM25421.1 hypothetical protein AOX55_00002169 [Sinorhizobium fredii CCBAU 25509]KSV90980.1 hypothetical protein N181_10185 [Sinorhizobium fredii USDA 205]GEC30441.1 hypothetical protein EFR01_06120 [Sinorhizobium fredii]